MSADALIEIARVTKPHGIRGAVVLHCSADHSSSLDGVDEMILEFDNGKSQTMSVVSVSGDRNIARVAFKGVSSRNDAELLRGARVLVKRDALEALDDDEFFHADLQGLRVVRESDGKEVGVVRSVRSLPANDVLEVEWLETAGVKGAKDLLVPFIQEAVPTVDIDTGHVVLNTDFLGVEFGEGDAS